MNPCERDHPERLRPDAGYRPDIDGLRGLAVTAVLLFHAGFTSVEGGFVGVDVFFVISGFLITRNIIGDVEAGAFTFSEFYVRRARRLFPALAFTLATTFVFGILLLSPEHLQMLAKSTIYAIGSASNLLFWKESGYFDAASHVKPLLHTWSLSVEEQFYFVWPWILVALLKVKRDWVVWLFLALAGMLSLHFAGRCALTDPAGAFYLPPFRVVEFAIGAACVTLVKHQPRNKDLLEPLFLVGLGAIVAPVVMYGDEVGVAGAAMLVPCSGAALLIYAGTARYSGWLLRNPVAVRLGLISYSLYLAHWPIIVFYRYYRFQPLETIEKVVLVASTIPVGALMYHLVEKPFRTKSNRIARLSPAAFATSCFGVALLLGVPAAATWQGVGWNVHYPAEVASILDEQERQRRWDSWRRAVRSGECFMTDVYLEHGATCLNVRGDAPNIVVFGDSHAADLWAALRHGYPKVNFLQATGASCVPIDDYHEVPSHRCNRMVSRIKGLLERSDDIDGVILSGRWHRHGLRAIEKELAYYHRHGIPVTVVGPSPEFEPDVLTLISRLARLQNLAEFAHRVRVREKSEISGKLRALVEKRQAAYVDRLGLFCDDSRCEVVDADRRLMFLDYGHWAVEGQRYAGQRLVAAFPTIDGMFAATRVASAR